METVKIDFEEVEFVSMKFNGKTIGYKNSLNLTDMIALINSYIEVYFFTNNDKFIDHAKYNYLGAEINLMIGLVKILTNIETSDDSGEIVFDVEKFVASGFFEEFIKNIKNYAYFRKILDRNVEEIKEQFKDQNSVNSSFKKLIDAGTSFINNANSMEITPDGLEKIKGLVDEIVKKVETSTIAEALNDKGRKTRKKQ